MKFMKRALSTILVMAMLFTSISVETFASNIDIVNSNGSESTDSFAGSEENQTEVEEGEQGEDPIDTEEGEQEETQSESQNNTQNGEDTQLASEDNMDMSVMSLRGDDDQDLSVQLMTLSADATDEVGVSVKVGKSSITVRINRVGSSGTAKLYRYDAEDYYVTDAMSGMSSDVWDNGDVISEYECGSTVDITFNRYDNDGTDNLYAKYYVVQDGQILVGPVYASEIYSIRSVMPFEQQTKKGLTLVDASTINTAIEMGVSNTVINMDLSTLILANEDENGNPIDNSGRSDVIEFESNGEIFYFNGDYVRAQDSLISAYSREGMNVTLVLIAWAKTCTDEYPAALRYLDVDENRQTMAFNTSTERGRQYWTAAMEFMASRYSRSTSCLVDKFIVGNEIDYTYDWYLLQPNQDENGNYQRVEFNTFMEEFARTLRIANMAVKKYNSEAKVCVSLTHNWALNCRESYNAKGNSIRINSYAPKDIVDWLSTYEKARGDYDWGLAVHPYPIGTTSSKPTVTDPAYKGVQGALNNVAMPITGDEYTSPWITAANLELYQLYLELPQNRYGDEVRTVSITETSILSSVNDKTTQYEQAASIAQYYYRAANIDCIDAIAYFQLTDQAETGYQLGLMTSEGVKKPAYDVWKYVDTNKTFNYSNRYLKYLSSTATSYKDIMPAVTSDFDWDVMWSEENIIKRVISGGDVVRTLESDKDTYNGDDPILVTATGDAGDYVGLYLATDDPADAEAIYSYPVQGTVDQMTYKSGHSYDIIAYGELSNRFAEGALKAGQYKLVLKRSDGEANLVKNITISENYSFGSIEHSLETNKTVYANGEEIIVTATGNTDCWVGLYNVNDTYGLGATTSIYWYYVNDPAGLRLSGKPTILQNTIHNTDSSNPADRIANGEYILYLFDGSGGNDYNAVMSKRITVQSSALEGLVSIDYSLSNETDGFANGTVVVTKDEANEAATECVMFWADEDGNPLEGYTGLAKFKLKGTRTTHKMYTHTVIPEGAKKLIAYASNGTDLSSTAVSVDLPADCTYDLEEGVLAEFQIVSDTHVTTDSGATGEVKLANSHFTQMLEDVKANSPESIGIFINGDIVNTGSNAEYLKVYDLYQKSLLAGNGDLPQLHISIGNHDWMAGNPGRQFQKYAKIFNDNLETAPEHVYYDEEIGGYHFIYLGGEEAGLRAVLSNEQLRWFEKRMQEITEEDPDKPVFVLLHQALYNTVAGTLPGQGWDGVVQETALKKILQKYGQIIIVGGHSHWELNSTSCMFAGDEEMAIALNTASVGYLWSSYNVSGGEFADGSHGYYVRVYEDKVVFLGRDFENSLYIPSAIFVLQKNKVSTSAAAYNISLDDAALNFDAKAAQGGEIVYASTDTSIASVTEDGTVIPKREGEVNIILTSYSTDKAVMDRKSVKVRIGDASVYRIYGKSRYETSFKVADTLKSNLGVEKFDTVVIASGTGFADALAGSYLAGVENAPILMTNGENVAEVQEYIRENLKVGGTVYLLGGKNALPDQVKSGLVGYKVIRLWGDTRYETNLEILKEAEVLDQEMIVCTGKAFADSLSASAVGRPILLVGDSLTDDQKEYLASLSTEKYYIIGGENAVSKDIEQELQAYGSVERIGGEDRYETSVLVAEKFFITPTSAVLAYSMNFPDGLCGGPLALSMEAPMLLTATDKEQKAVEYAKEIGVYQGMVLGGPTLISNGTVRNIFNLAPGSAIVEK